MRWVSVLEPLWWALFAAGGTMAALFVPAHLFVNNIAAPMGWVSSDAVSYETMAGLLSNPLVKLYLIVLLVPLLYHAAHRMSFLPHEFLLPVSHRVVGGIGYGLATVLSITMVVVVLLAP